MNLSSWKSKKSINRYDALVTNLNEFFYENLVYLKIRQSLIINSLGVICRLHQAIAIYFYTFLLSQIFLNSFIGGIKSNVFHSKYFVNIILLPLLSLSFYQFNLFVRIFNEFKFDSYSE